MKRRALFYWLAMIMPLAGQTIAPAAETDIPVIAQPQISGRTFNIKNFGAVDDGATLCTSAFTQAIDACDKAGGGVILVPPGRYLSAAFALKSKMNLHLEKGATILLSNRFSDYRLERDRYQDQITANNCQDVAITGEGIIDGQGRPWWDAFAAARAPDSKPFPHRPFMVVFKNCTRVLFDGITLTNSPSFHLVPQACTDVTIHKITITAPHDAYNTDGIDPSGWNFNIAECTIDTGDDNIAVKAGGKAGDKPSCMNFYIADCVFKHGHGLSIGGQTSAGLKHLVARNCTFTGTDAGIRMKASREAGGLVEDCLYENMTMEDVKNPISISSYYPERNAPKKNAADDPSKPITTTTPIYRNIILRNITAKKCPSAGRIVGLPEMPISEMRLENVRIQAQQGIKIWNAKNIELINCSITAEKGPAFDVQQSSSISGLPQ